MGGFFVLKRRIMTHQYVVMDTQCALVMEKEEVPFFTDETAFLDAVFGKDGENWTYFVRVLVKQFPSLVERRRATGPTAPLYVGWRSHLDIDTSYRRYEVLIGRCDAEDIILDAIKRCTQDPSLRSFYTHYQSDYAGK